jgi:hypothetical protein
MLYNGSSYRETNIMKRILSITLALIILCAFSTSAIAIEHGDSELSMGANFQTVSPKDGTEASSSVVNFSYGYYITPAWQVSSSIMVMREELTGSETTTTGLDLQGRYHLTFDKLPVKPFVGIQGGYMHMDSGVAEDGAGSYGFLTGVKYFASSNTSVNLEFNWKYADIDLGTGPSKYTIKTLLFGFSVLL